MNPDHLCMGCMSDKGAASICPHCGWREDSENESTIYLKPGTILNGKYLVGRVLGHGGFGITYLGWDKNLEIKLAIKEYLPRDLATRSQNKATVSIYTGEAKKHFKYGLEKFLEEGRALAKFEAHPGIVSVRDFFEENGTAYLAMHYIEGFTFKEYLEKKGGKISFETALKIMMPVMDALREVHGVDLLHRDISPDNIYITKSGQVKLIDFGAARYAMGEHSRSLSIILKPGFAPEEQYRSKGKQGPWTDIYAVAATIYRAITGRIPPEALDRLHEDTLKPPSNLGADISSSSEKALMKALSVRAADRFQSIREFQDALEKVPDPEQKYIQVNCPNCKTKNTVPEGTSLKEAKCKSCGSWLEKEAPPPPPPPQPVKGKRKKYPWIIAAVAAFVLIIFLSVGREGEEGTLNVTSNPSGAGFYFDGAYVADTPCDVKDISHGNHKVRVTKKKYKDYAETVYVAKGEKKRLRVELVPEPYGDLLIKSIPSGAKVYLEGNKKGTTPLALERVAKGSKEVKVIKQGYEDWTGTAMVKVGGAVEIVAELEKRKGPVKDVWRDPVTDMAFVWVPGGSFMMGSPDSEESHEDDEGSVHEVDVDGFWMGKYEVTNAQYRKFKPDHNSKKYKGHSLNGEKQSAVMVTWKDADEFTKWLTRKNGGKFEFRLPTEAEWEYACRAGTKTARFWGDDPDDACKYANVADKTAKREWSGWAIHNCDDGYAVTSPVGSFRHNAFGLYDMLGNVWEWCEDWHDSEFYGKPAAKEKNPLCEDSSSGYRVLRGGTWREGPGHLRCANRDWLAPDIRYANVGFRLIRQKSTEADTEVDTPEQILEKVEPASLRVTTNPAGARVYLNGKKMGVGPVNFDDLKPGEITVRAEHPGYKSAEKTVRLSPGKNYEVTLTLVLKLFRFSVKTQPPNARVEFVGLDKKYAPGMELEPGKYRIVVSKPGYKSFEQWVELGHEDLTVPVELKKLLGKLTVDIKPKDARIRILNIKAKFEQGMELEPGRYQIEVSKQGYMTHEEWVALDKEDLTVSVELEKLYEFKVSTKPSDAIVRLMKDNRSFKQGMLVKAGEYEVEVSHPKYVTKTVKFAVPGQVPVIVLNEEVAKKSVWNDVTAPPGGQSHHHYTIVNPVNCAITITNITKSASAPAGVTIDYDTGQSFNPNYLLEVGDTVSTQLFFNVSDSAQSGTMRSSIKFTYTSACGGGSKSSEGSTKILLSPSFLGNRVVEEGDLFRRNSLGMKFVYIPPGTFMMGSPSDEPEHANDETQHKVRLTKGFYMQTTEVTNGQFVRFLNYVRKRGPKKEPWFETKKEELSSHILGSIGNFRVESGYEDHPVTKVSWYGAVACANWLSGKTGNKYRLPTEAEWEYACRAGKQTPFSFGRCLSTKQANYFGNFPLKGCDKGEFREKTVPVASLNMPNAWGFYDMHGNVWEWCQDWYDDYPSGLVVDPKGPSRGKRFRVLRGGNWLNCASNCRSAFRGYDTPGDRTCGIGFRLLQEK